MKLSLLVVFLMMGGAAPAAVLASLLEDTTTSFTIDQSHRRLPIKERTTDDLKAETSEAEELRNLRESLPADLSICDEYFFGRQTNLPADQVPFCVNGG